MLAAALVGDPDRTVAMTAVIWRWAIVLGLDFLWSFSYTLRPRRPRRALPGSW
jgi:hypothetical protein